VKNIVMIVPAIHLREEGQENGFAANGSGLQLPTVYLSPCANCPDAGQRNRISKYYNEWIEG